MMRRNFTESAKGDEKKALTDTVSSQKKGYKQLVETGVTKFKQSNFSKLIRY